MTQKHIPVCVTNILMMLILTLSDQINGHLPDKIAFALQRVTST